jgi:basic membrane protein A
MTGLQLQRAFGRGRWISACLLLVAALTLAACNSTTNGEGGSGGDDKGGSDKGGSSTKVGLVTDIGGLNDRSFNALANVGLEQAKKELGTQGSVLESKSAGDYESNLGQFAQQNFGLAIAVGFLQVDAIKSVSAKFPKVNFAIVDPSDDYKPGSNVRALRFKEQEAGYLVGALAGMIEQDGKLKGLNGSKTLSAVGGQSIPPVNRYVAGFQAGVKRTCPGCKVLVAYSQEFIAQDKCKEQALTQIGQGSDIVFQVAGGCGLGALDAAKSKGIWGIGVDADQAYLGDHILTSAVKRVDKAVFDTISAVKNGTFSGGDSVYGLKEDGVGIGVISPAAKAYEAKLQPIIEDVKNGKVEVPSEITK